MGMYRIYHVATAKIMPGKSGAAAAWWREKGKAAYEGMAGVVEVQAYVGQFGLGGEYGLEIWTELENYAAYDRIDEDVVANPQKYAVLREAQDVLEWGPSRLMGEWPESELLPT